MSPSALARTILVAAMFGASFSGVAFARDQVFNARLAAPTAESRVIAGNALWTCAADNCVARVSQDASVRACRQFVRETGIAVTAYGPEGGQLSSEELAQCNSIVVAPTQQAQN